MTLEAAVGHLIESLPGGSGVSRFTVQGGETVEFSITKANEGAERRLSIVYLNVKAYPKSGIAILGDNNAQDTELESCQALAERLFSTYAPIENVVNEVRSVLLFPYSFSQ